MKEGTRPQVISEHIVQAILTRRLAPGVRLGEQVLADLFGASRIAVRQALTGLAARGMVEANQRRGWYVVQPSEEDALEVFATRKVIEAGVVMESIGKLDKASVKRLRDHVALERAATASGDVAERSFLLGDFHVCLAECIGNSLLAEIMRDLTARTTLIASLVQTRAEAQQSCSEHAAIIATLQRGESAKAVELMREHLDNVARQFNGHALPTPFESLRSALLPRAAARRSAAPPAIVPRKKLFTPLLRAVPRSEKA